MKNETLIAIKNMAQKILKTKYGVCEESYFDDDIIISSFDENYLPVVIIFSTPPDDFITPKLRKILDTHKKISSQKQP